MFPYCSYYIFYRTAVTAHFTVVQSLHIFPNCCHYILYCYLGAFQTEPLYFILFDFIKKNNSFKNEKNGALFKRALDAVLRSNWKRWIPILLPRWNISSRPLLSDYTQREVLWECHTPYEHTKEDRCLLLPATSRGCCCLLLLSGVKFVRLVGEVRSFCRHTNIASNNREEYRLTRRCKKTTAIQQKKHVIAECVGAS